MELEGIIIGRTQTLLKDDAPGEGGYDETEPATVAFHHQCFSTTLPPHARGSPNKRKWTFGKLSKNIHSPPHWKQHVLVKTRTSVVTFPLILMLVVTVNLCNGFSHLFYNCVTFKSYLASGTLSFLIWKMGIIMLFIWHSIWVCVCIDPFPFPYLKWFPRHPVMPSIFKPDDPSWSSLLGAVLFFCSGCFLFRHLGPHTL